VCHHLFAVFVHVHCAMFSVWKYSFADSRIMPRARRFMPK